MLFLALLHLALAFASIEADTLEKRDSNTLTNGVAVTINNYYTGDLTVQSDGLVVASQSGEPTRFRVYNPDGASGDLVRAHAFKITTLDGTPCRVESSGNVRCSATGPGTDLIRILDKHGDDRGTLYDYQYVKFRIPGNGVDCQVKASTFNCIKKESYQWYGFTISIDHSIQPDDKKPPTAQPPTAQPPTAQPPTAQPPTAQPPTAQPPARPIVGGSTIKPGCYQITANIGGDKNTYSARVITDNMSRDRCQNFQCPGFDFAALANGNACFCFNANKVAQLGASSVEQTQCSAPCTKAPGQTCGGPSFNIIEFVKVSGGTSNANGSELVDEAVDTTKQNEVTTQDSTSSDNSVPGWGIGLLVIGCLCVVSLTVLLVVVIRRGKDLH